MPRRCDVPRLRSRLCFRRRLFLQSAPGHRDRLTFASPVLALSSAHENTGVPFPAAGTFRAGKLRITACRRSAPPLHFVSLRCSVARTLRKRLTCSPFCFARVRVVFGILEARAPRRASDTSGLRPDVAYTFTLYAFAPGKEYPPRPSVAGGKLQSSKLDYQTSSVIIFQNRT